MHSNSHFHNKMDNSKKNKLKSYQGCLQSRRYREKSPEKERERCRKSYLGNKKQRSQYKKEYYEKNKEKVSMWNRINYLKRKNIISLNKCENCGNKESLIMHHDDYDKPFEIMVLCRSCHNKLHKLIKS